MMKERKPFIENYEIASVKTFEGHTSEVLCLAWNEQDNILFSSSWDANIKIWKPF